MDASEMVDDQDEIYQEHILDHYEDPYHRGHCAHPTHEHQEKNPLCGDIIRVEMTLGDDGKIDELYFNGEGCCISQAAASMLVEYMDGKTTEDIKRFTARDMLDLFRAPLTPNRQKCCLLSWRALQSAVHAPTDEAGETTEANDATASGRDPGEET